MLGVSLTENICVKSVTNDFVDDSLVNNVSDDSVLVVETDMIT